MRTNFSSRRVRRLRVRIYILVKVNFQLGHQRVTFERQIHIKIKGTCDGIFSILHHTATRSYYVAISQRKRNSGLTYIQIRFKSAPGLIIFKVDTICDGTVLYSLILSVRGFSTWWKRCLIFIIMCFKNVIV